MPELSFSLPYNDNEETLRQLFGLQGLGGNTISEIYLSCPQQFSGSGRVTPRTSMERFKKTIELIHSQGIRVNLILNSTCQGADWYTSQAAETMLGFLESMHKNHGAEAVTIANPIYIRKVRQRLPDVEICASVLSDIDNVKKAMIVREYGADTITPDANINRDPEMLKAIKEATGVKLKLMVNEGCLYKCPFRKFHFNFVSHWSKELEHSSMEGKDFFDHCLTSTLEDRSQILKSGWIRPEDLEKYSDITTSFKVVGRARGMHLVLRAAGAYMRQQYEGNLIDILCSSLNAFGLAYGAYLDNDGLGKCGFFEKISSCDKRCLDCDYCDKLAEKMVRINVVTRGKLEDLGRKEIADKLEAEGKLPYCV